MAAGAIGQSLDLALIGNCQYSALVDTHGCVVWTCFPRFDSPSVFAALLDTERGGHWTIEGDGDGWRTESRYLENTCILTTHWQRDARDESFDVIDFAPRFFLNDRYFRPTMLVRIVRPVRGRPRVCTTCDPRFDYGKRAPRLTSGSNHLTYHDPESLDRLRLTTNASLTHVAQSMAFTLDRDLYFALAWDEPFEASFAVLEDFLGRTQAYWRRWGKRTRVPVDYQDVVLRAAMTLKLHAFEDTGAVVAATTSSIPEAEGTQRTWDYRYCWIRDGAFVVRSLLRMGHSEEAESFGAYLRNLLPRSGANHFALQPAYGIDGRSQLDERTLTHLRGYRGHAPVRIGNDAYTHTQNDVHGEVVLGLTPLFYDSRLLGEELEPVFEHIKALVHAAIETFPLPDAGIWEFRGITRHHVFSKLMSWCALDRASRIAGRMGKTDLAGEWRRKAGTMKEEILARGFSERVGSFVTAYDCEELDASLLLMPVLGFLPVDDPRIVSSIECMRRGLDTGGFVYRYRHADDFGEQHSAFSICSTWMVEALWLTGRREEARDRFERLLVRRNRFGLLSEDINPATGELWGNFPQTYSMLGLINCAVRLSPSWDEVF